MLMSDIIALLDGWTVAIGFTVLVLMLLVQAWLREPANLPPVPGRPHLLLGHLPYLGAKRREQMAQWRKTTGDVFRLYMGRKPLVVLCGYSVLKEALIKHGDLFVDRPPGGYATTVVQDGTKGVLGASGAAWREQRAVAMSILRKFGMGKNSLADKIQEEITAYLDVLSGLCGQPTDVKRVTSATLSNVICSIIVGKRFEYDDPYFLQFMDTFSEQVRLVSSTSMINVFPWLRYWPGDMFGAKRFIDCHHDLDNIFSDPFIAQKTKEYEAGGDALDNFISAYVHEWRRKEQGGETTTMDGGHLRRLLGNLFIAGSETTATTMLWFMLYMLHYPHIQEKVFAELEEVVGHNRRPTMQDKSRLPYLNAVIMETQRRASIAPFSLSRICTADVTLQGYLIPRGTRVVSNLDSVLLDEVTWGDPLNFRPERFLDNHGGLIHPDEFVPFSMGRRVCLGESLAKMELFLFLAALVQRFRLLPSVPGQLPPQKALFGVTCPPEPFTLRLKERSDSAAD
ncbi:hypothetical protein RRG08_005954 [Elysia crispata]|uniref:Cytochrome P450 n=1 Tax=Elysia crispata TaxID=231223 RepID=A0AAE0YPK0_9GAST|nr:hypothetical protein RRG08_005954 [Elysia crispata]